MPWVPELFSAPIIARFEAKQRQKVVDIPYFEGLLAGRPTARAPLLPPDPELRTPTPVGRYIGGLAGCDADAVVAAFEADGRAREPDGAEPVHVGAAGLRSFCAARLDRGGGGRLAAARIYDEL
jgi:hypothetical protein